ncbi:MAG: enoyl-CoA hydratase-related protein [Bacillota bacterium]|nr:enoyl-CoA hydratase-related protein [Bacillota bacterium]
MSENVILFEKKDNYAVITLNRPPMNPLSSQVFHELNIIIEEIESDSAVKAVIITSSGVKAFAAGVDITEIGNLTPIEMYEFCALSMNVFSKLENLSKPTIAVMRGLVLGGGCELSLCCDFRLAAENAKFAQPEINLGIIPGGGGTKRLPRLIGLARAKELLFLGEMIDAAAAEKFGLVNKVLPDEELMEYAEKMAKNLASKPSIAMKMLKKTVNMGEDLDVNSATNLEIESFIVTFASDDRVEGIRAMLEKRKPVFQGK